MVERLGQVDVGGLSKDEKCLAAVKKSYIHYIETAWRTVRAKGGKTQVSNIFDRTDALSVHVGNAACRP